MPPSLFQGLALVLPGVCCLKGSTSLLVCAPPGMSDDQTMAICVGGGCVAFGYAGQVLTHLCAKSFMGMGRAGDRPELGSGSARTAVF